MKVKFGALMTDGRGKIGGHVMSKNRGGAYMRSKVTPVNPQTAYQSTVRSRFGDLSSAWRGLTQAQRDAWNGIVAQYSRTDIFGDLKNPSGLALYQRLNNNLAKIGVGTISWPLAPVAVPTVIAGTLTATTGVQLLSLALSGAVPQYAKVVVRATAPMSAGKNFVKSEFRQIGVFNANQASPLALTAMYTAKFGGVGAVGTKVFVQLEFVSIITGLTSGVQTVSQIVAA